ncbi:ABC transporter permease subunit [Paenibacillus chungangensis]|uniref:ABC transporter permease subunit n=1 Tax=Paenibacillus chungangensis TaxID=696535 RepID=A0ABW3HWV4_9BACL
MSGVSRWFVLLGKEVLELQRSFKLIWVPLLFILLGIMQPVSTYYLPFILEKAGNMPEGTVIEIPMPEGGQVLADTLSQFGVMGLLVLVLVFMGTVSGERNSGAASLVLVKPISFSAYISAKWVAMQLLAWGSLLAGYVAAWYYTWLLIEVVPIVSFLSSFAMFGLWLSFVMTLTILFSTVLRSAAGAAFAALGVSLLLSMLTGLLPKYMEWSPGAISGYAYALASGAGLASVEWGLAVGVTIAVIVAALYGAAALLRRSPAID